MPLSMGRGLQALGGRQEEIVAAFLRLRSDAAVARQVGLQVGQVRRVVDASVPEARVLRRARRSSSQTFADRELTAALRQAARELPSPLAIESYRRWAQERSDGRPCPGPEAIILRFAGWRRALIRAGLPSNARHGPQRRLRLRHGRAGRRCRLAGDGALPERRALRRLAWRTIAVPRRSDRQTFRPKLGRPSGRCLFAGLSARRTRRAGNDCLARPFGTRDTLRSGADCTCPIGSGRQGRRGSGVAFGVFPFADDVLPEIELAVGSGAGAHGSLADIGRLICVVVVRRQRPAARRICTSSPPDVANRTRCRPCGWRCGGLATALRA